MQDSTNHKKLLKNNNNNKKIILASNIFPTNLEARRWITKSGPWESKSSPKDVEPHSSVSERERHFVASPGSSNSVLRKANLKAILKQ